MGIRSSGTGLCLPKISSINANEAPMPAFPPLLYRFLSTAAQGTSAWPKAENACAAAAPGDSESIGKAGPRVGPLLSTQSPPFSL